MIIRLLRIFFSMLICLLLIPVAVSIALGASSGQDISKVMGGFFFVSVLSSPVLLPALLLLLGALIYLDSRNNAKLWPYVGVWVLVAIVGERMLVGFVPSPMNSQFLIYAPLSVGLGLIYWALVGQAAARPEISISNFSSQPLAKQIVAVAIAPIAASVVFLLSTSATDPVQPVSVIRPMPDLGTPPFTVAYEREMTELMKIAIDDFQTAASCTSEPNQEIASGQLVLLDWDKIETNDEAKVCIFRLLASYGDAGSATDWFELQGFKVNRERFSSQNPNVDRDSNLAIQASWSIREKGLRFPTKGFRFSLAYGMGIYSNWSADGQTLLNVGISFSIL